jgi:predicted DNA-binding transcriptional regulator AlpA
VPHPALSDPVEHLRDHPAAIQPGSLTAAVEPLLVSARRAAALCGVSVATWHRWNAAGRCPAPLRVTPGSVRWRAEELREWIAAGCVPRREWDALRSAQRNGRPR